MKRTKIYAVQAATATLAPSQTCSNGLRPLIQRAAAGPAAKPAPRPAPTANAAPVTEGRAEVNQSPDLAAAGVVPQGKLPASGRVDLVGPGASYAPPPGHVLLCFIHRDGSAVKFAGAAGAVFLGPGEVEREYGPLAAQARTLLASHPAAASTPTPAHASAAPAHAKTVSRAAESAGAGVGTDGSAVQRAFDSSALRPLTAESRSKLEHSYGADLGSVRVHTDSAADQAARSVQAHAFTTGQDIYFLRRPVPSQFDRRTETAGARSRPYRAAVRVNQ